MNNEYLNLTTYVKENPKTVSVYCWHTASVLKLGGWKFACSPYSWGRRWHGFRQSEANLRGRKHFLRSWPEWPQIQPPRPKSWGCLRLWRQIRSRRLSEAVWGTGPQFYLQGCLRTWPQMPYEAVRASVASGSWGGLKAKWPLTASEAMEVNAI